MKSLKSQIKDVTTDTRKSSKTGKDYNVVTIEFQNGYKHESFLNNEQQFILNQIADNK